MVSKLLSIFFPPSLGVIRDFAGVREHMDPFVEVPEGKILWVAYDVRQDAIERHWREEQCLQPAKKFDLLHDPKGKNGDIFTIGAMASAFIQAKPV